MTGNRSERTCVLAGCKALWNSVFHGAGPATDMGRMEQLNYRGRSLEVTGHESACLPTGRSVIAEADTGTGGARTQPPAKRKVAMDRGP